MWDHENEKVTYLPGWIGMFGARLFMAGHLSLSAVIVFALWASRLGAITIECEFGGSVGQGDEVKESADYRIRLPGWWD